MHDHSYSEARNHRARLAGSSRRLHVSAITRTMSDDAKRTALKSRRAAGCVAVPAMTRKALQRFEPSRRVRHGRLTAAREQAPCQQLSRLMQNERHRKVTRAAQGAAIQ